MSITPPKEFDEQVYAVVAAIPPGKVMSYGQISLALGCPNQSRRVGRAMRGAPEGLPCHRVVNASGGTAPGWAEQIDLLRAEGAAVKDNGNVDMKRCAWWPGRGI